MWSIGVYDYHLPPDQVFKITPAQFYELGKRFNAERKSQDYGFGIVASTIANCHSTKKRFKPEDFMPQYGKKKKQSPKEMRAMWAGVVGKQKEVAKVEKKRKERLERIQGRK